MSGERSLLLRLGAYKESLTATGQVKNVAVISLKITTSLLLIPALQQRQTRGLLETKFTTFPHLDMHRMGLKAWNGGRTAGQYGEEVELAQELFC